MSEKNNPVQRPGDGARAFDTIREQFTANAKRFQQERDWSEADYFEEMTLLLAYMSGYSGKTPLHEAFNIVSELVHERRHIE